MNESLKLIQKIKTAYPELRIGQIIGNAVEESDLYYMEDEDLLKALLTSYNKFYRYAK